MIPFTSDEIQHIASEAAKQAVRELLVAMGVDANDPKALIAMQKDFAHIRHWRENVETLQSKGLGAAVVAIVLFVGGAVLYALRGH